MLTNNEIISRVLTALALLLAAISTDALGTRRPRPQRRPWEASAALLALAGFAWLLFTTAQIALA